MKSRTLENKTSPARKVAVAVVQSASVAFCADKSVTKAAKLCKDAAKHGARIVVFPEAFVSGYPKGLDFGVCVGNRSAAGREDFRRYSEGAIDENGEETAQLSAAARRHKIYLVIGVIERAIGTLYCTILFFAPDGKLIGKHRKLMPTAGERLIWGFGDGSTLPVFDTTYGRLGAVICWENYMPLLRMAMYAKGVSLYCAPTADDRETWLPTMRHVAMEGRCFVLSSCQCTRRRDYPNDYALSTEFADREFLMRGGSCIIDPMGNVLAGPVFDRETLLYADLDMNEVPRARMDFDAAGHYARPDVFSLVVNERPQPAVQFIAADANPAVLSKQKNAKK